MGSWSPSNLNGGTRIYSSAIYTGKHCAVLLLARKLGIESLHVTDVIALVAAFTALCAVVLGPLVSMWAAARQSRVAVLSANRQAWINSLRDLIAECLSTAGLVQLADWSTRPQSEFEEKMERLAFLIAKIRLMLNPNEQDHQQLVGLLQELMGACGGLKSTDAKNRDAGAKAGQTLVPLSQAVLKREWERVKRME